MKRALKDISNMDFSCHDIPPKNPVRLRRVMKVGAYSGLSECYKNVGLFDLGLKAKLYTWCNKRMGERCTWVRLDRGEQIYPNASVCVCNLLILIILHSLSAWMGRAGVGMGKSMTELQRYLEALLDKKDMYWQIRLKANRLTCGDRNAGGVLDDLADIENHIVELNFDDLFQDVHVPSLSREDSDWLMRSFIEEEYVKECILKRFKSLK
ncbi:hypothetical protein M9H77_30952 [Catharanthus roseus]|uniref:Uncharacterized protein n=1 Tax=Catharanthus roseus TaxID=4058 RepID=A0ACC0A0J7_CATRO|nr:hypothetical protein M9H77_30952 [Catharanthus roseus]